MAEHKLPTIEIDCRSGFCFGVVTAIRKAEEELATSGRLYCLGDIVHNSDEVERLRQLGLVTITHAEMEQLHGVKVLLRAHGEPPATYELARRNNIEIIDATCPVVLALQQKIKEQYTSPGAPQIVIYGKRGHAEVLGLVGQTDGQAVVVESAEELGGVDTTRPVALYSQTTKGLQAYRELSETLGHAMAPGAELRTYDTICRQVAHRVDHLRAFAAEHSLVLFVAGHKSSNGRILFNECKDVNPHTHLVANADEVDPAWLVGADSIGICGATSTPRWLMDDIRSHVLKLLS